MNIVHGKITMRSIEERDLPFCLEMMNDPRIEMSTVGKSFPASSQRQSEWFFHGDNEHEIRLMIETANSSQIGMLILSDINWINRSAEIGIKFSPLKSRERSETEDAANGILKYVFDELNLHCVYANVLEDNLFSRKLLIQFGFSEEGKLRDRVYKRGRYHNVVVYSLLRDEYMNKE